jgi:pimeloyl-ACP methyl ester carboxylesterase
MLLAGPRAAGADGEPHPREHAAPPRPAPPRPAPRGRSFWQWNGHRIRYQRSGESGPAVVLVHGFGGNADHWRKSTGELGRGGHRAFAIDLLGYGYSDKPDPRRAPLMRRCMIGFRAALGPAPAFKLEGRGGGPRGAPAGACRGAAPYVRPRPRLTPFRTQTLQGRAAQQRLLL